MRWFRCCLLTAALVVTVACSSGESTEPTPQNTLLSRVSAGGTLPVIVTLAGDFVPEGALPDDTARQAQRRRISAAQSAVLEELEQNRISAVRRFAYTPQLALTVDAAALTQLLRSKRVAAVQEDTAQPTMGETS